MKLSPWSVLLVCLSGSLLFAQEPGSRAAFEAAANLGKLSQSKVFRTRVQPHWLPGNSAFWYDIQTGPDSREFFLVDAEHGARRPAFDAPQLAAALSKAGVSGVRAENLPLEQLDLQPAARSMEFRAAGKTWRFGLDSNELSELPPRPPKPVESSLQNPRRTSRSNGAETQLTFTNRTAAEVELFWLDTEGDLRSYGRLRPGESRTQNTFAGHVWKVTDAAGKPLGFFTAPDAPGSADITLPAAPLSPAAPEIKPRRRDKPPGDVSPDGVWRALLKENNVWLRNVQSGEEFALSKSGVAGNAFGGRVEWAPDSKKLVVLQTKAGTEHKIYLVESSPAGQVQPKLQTVDYLKPGDDVPVSKPHLFAIENREEIPIEDALFPNPWSLDNVRWAADSSRFTFLYNQRGHQVLRIVAVDAQSGQARPLIDERSDTFICYSGKAFTEYLDATSEIIWMSERDGWNHLFLFDAASGQLKNQITRGSWVVRQVDRVDREKRQIWFQAGGIYPGQDPYYLHFCRINFDGSGLTLLTEGDGTHSVEFSPDGRFLIDSYSRVDLPPVTDLRAATDGHLVCALEKADASALIASGWHAPERFVARGRDGLTDIYGIINRPRSFDPAKKYAVIENIYAGPQSAFVPKNFSALNRMQELAELGFIVVQIDGMGTSLRSKAFHDVCWKNLADAGFPDRILWLKAAAAHDPALDLSRVGIYGTSAGGQNALGGLLLHGDFYKAGMADSGCHDNRMDKIWWNEQWMGWPVGAHYAEQSNVTLAPRLTGKLLLMAGELDKNVDPASTLQVVNALIKADKDFEFLLVPGAGHGVAGSPYGKHRVQDFFVRSLLGVVPRAAP